MSEVELVANVVYLVHRWVVAIVVVVAIVALALLLARAAAGGRS